VKFAVFLAIEAQGNGTGRAQERLTNRETASVRFLIGAFSFAAKPRVRHRFEIAGIAAHGFCV
jgi:hypothetical protein